MTGEKYRLNCLMPAMYGERLSEISEATGLPKVYIIQQALNTYFTTYDAQKKLMEAVSSDPLKAVEIAKALGLT